MWRFPQPVHPIEAVAALRGFGGYEPCSPSQLASDRWQSWMDYTEQLAGVLMVHAPTLRLVWHLVTPLNVPAGLTHPGMAEALTLWRALGFRQGQWFGAAAVYHTGQDGATVPVQERFWTDACPGRIEL